MEFDREALERLLALNDTQLRFIIGRLAAEYGIDLSSFNIQSNDIESVRRALREATDEDLRRVTEQAEAVRRQRGTR